MSARPWTARERRKAWEALDGARLSINAIDHAGRHLRAEVPAGREGELAAAHLEFYASREDARAERSERAAVHALESGIWSGERAEEAARRFRESRREAEERARAHRRLAARIEAEGMPPRPGEEVRVIPEEVER